MSNYNSSRMALLFKKIYFRAVSYTHLAQKADVIMVAPATANVIAKLAHGLADDMLTTTILASKAPKIIAPAMNTGMYENPVTQDNLKLLKKYGMEVITPANGWLACGDVGAGKMPEPEDLFEYILKCIACKKDLRGKKVLVTAGPTQEAIDPVRYINNHSSGKMGYSLAKACMLRGADVTLVTGKTAPVSYTHPYIHSILQEMVSGSPFPDFLNIVPAQGCFHHSKMLQ